MEASDLDFFKQWFSGYCRSFYSLNPDDQENMLLKERHTHIVCRNIIQIAKELSLSDNDIRLAETAALFHDIGRFKQYSLYKTFRDNVSLNHGFLGSDILAEAKVLQRLPVNEQDLIVQAVRFHNAFSLADLQNEEKIMFLKLVRDADKLDIWRVFMEYYATPERSRPSAVGLELPDSPGCSEEVLSCLYKRQSVSLSDIKNLNDFKIMLLSWVYDLNFKASFRLLAARDIINSLAAGLPLTDDIKHAVAGLHGYIAGMQS